MLGDGPGHKFAANSEGSIQLDIEDEDARSNNGKLVISQNILKIGFTEYHDNDESPLGNREIKFGAKLPVFQEASDSERDLDRDWNFAGSQQNYGDFERESQQVISLPQSQAMTPEDRQLSLGMLEAHLALQDNEQSDQKSYAADSLS